MTGSTQPICTNVADPRANAMLASLSAASFAKLAPHLRVRDVGPGTQLWSAGTAPPLVYFPVTGIISVSLAIKEARLIEIASIGREAAAGGIGGTAAASTRGIALTGGRLIVMPAPEFNEIARWEQEIGDATRTACVWIGAQAQQFAACNAVHKIQARLARWLLHATERLGGDPVVATQETLADALGLRRTSVTLVAKGLRNRGIISYYRGAIRIRDRDRLRAMACECYGALSHARWPFLRREEAAPSIVPIEMEGKAVAIAGESRR